MDDPSSVGARILPPGDALTLDSSRFVATESRSVRGQLVASSGSRLMVGRHGDIQAWSLLRFTPLPDTLANVSALSAELQLRSLYVFGNELSLLSFRIRKIAVSWDADSVTFDSVQVPGFVDPAIVADASFPPIADSAVVTVPLDTALVSAWIRSITDSSVTAYGIALEPTSSDVIYGFGRFSAGPDTLRPTLKVTYLRTDTALVDTVYLRAGSDSYVASIADTSWASSAERLYVRNGIGYRGLLDFSLDSLPVNPAVHNATLQIVLDPAASQFNRFTRDSLQAIYITEDGFQDLVSYLNEPPVVVDGYTRYSFTVTQIVQAWLRGAPVHRLGIAGANENSAFDLFVLFGSGATDSALRPTLIIMYSDTQ